MPEDASLDDFLGESANSGGDDGAGRESETAEPAEADEVSDAAAVEPASSTYEWSPEGAPCEACGEVVRARWRDDGDRVCADCKEW